MKNDNVAHATFTLNDFQHLCAVGNRLNKNATRTYLVATLTVTLDDTADI